MMRSRIKAGSIAPYSQETVCECVLGMMLLEAWLYHRMLYRKK